LKAIVNQQIFEVWIWDKKKYSLRVFSGMFSYMDVNFWDAVYIENHGEK
jgi:hypothetical protein